MPQTTRGLHRRTHPASSAWATTPAIARLLLTLVPLLIAGVAIGLKSSREGGEMFAPEATA